MPPCEECAKPAQLLSENRIAWQAWQICHEMGREEFGGIMQASETIAVLETLGGDMEDLDRVCVIERLFQELNPQEEKEPKGP